MAGSTVDLRYLVSFEMAWLEVVGPYLIVGTLCLGLPLDIWRFIFHSAITPRFVREAFRGKTILGVVPLYLAIHWVYWALSSAIIIASRGSILGHRVFVEGSIHVTLLGLILAVAGVLLIVWSVVSIGPKTLVRIPEFVPSKQELVTSGPYSIVRHPIYLGEFASILGVFLATGSTLVACQFIIKLFLMYPVIIYEEKELTRRFGEKYREYQRLVPMIIPVPKELTLSEYLL